MHKTLSSHVIGYIDTAVKIKDTLQISGWCLTRKKEATHIRILSSTNEPILLSNIPRPDVCQFYNLDALVDCGWKETLPYAILPCHIQMEVDIKTHQ